MEEHILSLLLKGSQELVQVLHSLVSLIVPKKTLYKSFTKQSHLLLNMHIEEKVQYKYHVWDMFEDFQVLNQREKKECVKYVNLKVCEMKRV